ncbi:MAG: MBL fold metallo-hydrolase [Candidatus Dormibacteria bacterium]
MVEGGAVENITPHVKCIRVPIPDSPLKWTFVYLIDDPEGPILIDTGWDAEESWQVLLAGLHAAGVQPGDLAGVILTHFHPDHSGLARRIPEVSDAWIGLHWKDQQLLAAGEVNRADVVYERMATYALDAGAPELTQEEEDHLSLHSLRDTSALSSYRNLEDTMTIGSLLHVVATPGHTPGHCSVHIPRDGLLLLGDHLLPRITPNVSVYSWGDDNPLASYVASLLHIRRIAKDTPLMFPAHEGQIVDAEARVMQVIAHHGHRLQELLGVLEDGSPRTVWETASRLSWSRSWDLLSGDPMRRAAIGEAGAHLVFLEHLGLLTRSKGQPLLWQLSSSWMTKGSTARHVACEQGYKHYLDAGDGREES